jgi:hypothetical protein
LFAPVDIALSIEIDLLINHGRQLVKGDMLSIKEPEELYGERPPDTFVNPSSKF